MLGHEHLVAIELDLVLVYCHPFLYLGEIQHSGKGERIVHIEVNPEHRVLFHRIELVIELQIVFVLKLRRGLGPYGDYVVDHVVLLGLDALSVLPLGLFAEHYADGHELAVFAKELRNLAFLGVLGGVIVKVEGDFGTSLALVPFCQRVLGRAVAGPLDRLGAFLPAEGIDGNFLRNHKSRIEAKPEVTYDGAYLILVFLKELPG